MKVILSICGNSKTVGKAFQVELVERMCHALVIVFCVFVIYLVRPGCDMGLCYCIFVLGFVVFGIAAD